MGEVDKLVGKVNKRYWDSKKNESLPLWTNELNYETNFETLEPVYFWIIDFSKKFFGRQEKIKDNFTASPGSSYFADLGQRATRMQEEAMKILGYVNTVTKSILNIIYDLKEFEIRFKHYNDANNSNPKIRDSGISALKQVWISSVDSKRGMGSIDNMAHQYGFTLLRPAFMAANSPEKVDSMDINDMIKKILKPRISEFFEWVKLSEKELRKRYAIEKSYLNNQVKTLNLYTSWIKPYLSVAEQLRMGGESSNPDLVSVFGTMNLELEILGVDEFDFESAVVAKDLPLKFKNLEKNIRKFYEVLTMTFSFRTFPVSQTSSPHAGKVRIKFTSYVLNEDEYVLFKKLKKDKNLSDIFGVTNITGETLEILKDDIEKYTKESEEEKPKREMGMFEGIFHDLMEGMIKEKKKAVTPEEIESKENAKAKMLEQKGISKDSFEESVVREVAEMEAISFCFKIYDTFKKSKGMASFPSPFDEPDVVERIKAKKREIEATLKKK